MMDGRPLNHLELMSIANKDEQYYKEWIGDTAQELAQKCLGMRRWIQYQNAVTVLSRFGYFATTTLTQLATPGEDFCEATPNSNNTLRNLLMILLNNSLRWPKEIPKFYANVLKDIHLITFFLFGDFYEISKRVTNFSYSTQDINTHQNKPLLIIYRILGCLSAIKLLINVIKHSNSEDNNSGESGAMSLEVTPSSSSHQVDIERLCHLCSDTRKEPTSTLCGHIFCWTCIHKWIRDKGECPICRTPTDQTRLVHRYVIKYLYVVRLRAGV